MSQLLTVALAQYPSGRDCMEIVGAAKAAAAEIVVFPEMYSNGYACLDPKHPAAKPRGCGEAESLEGRFRRKVPRGGKGAPGACGIHVSGEGRAETVQRGLA